MTDTVDPEIGVTNDATARTVYKNGARLADAVDAYAYAVIDTLAGLPDKEDQARVSSIAVQALLLTVDALADALAGLSGGNETYFEGSLRALVQRLNEQGHKNFRETMQGFREALPNIKIDPLDEAAANAVRDAVLRCHEGNTSGELQNRTGTLQ